MSKKAIGIDLGTGNSCVTVIEGGKPTVIINEEGNRTTPSVIGFGKDGEIKIGSGAKRQAVTNPTNTVSFIKRFMGEKYNKVKYDIDRAPYKVIEDKNGNPRVVINEKEYSPEEISAMILQKMKSAAEAYLGCDITDAVITCPAYYDAEARKAVENAGKIAGLNVLRIINEPTAAALAYGLDKKKLNGKIVVYDFGSGTLDISVLDMSDDGVIEVLSTNGDTHLGGEDFDQKIIDWISDEFKQENGVDLKKDPMALQRLKEAAEKAKIELSSQLSTDINLPYITAVDNQPIHLMKTLSRANFEAICADIFDKAISPASEALKLAKIEKNEISNVILVGGSTRIPKVKEIVKEFFNQEPDNSVNPDEAVAQGAAIMANTLSNPGENDILLLDILPMNIGVETQGGVFTTVIEGNTTIPVKKSQIFSTAADNQSTVQINIAQGMRPMYADNKQLGSFFLDGIAPAPRGVPQIDVTIDVDSNGIMTVSAKDMATGKEQNIRIEANSALTPEEIEKMKEEARINEEADKKRREEIDLLNSYDSLVFGIEKSLKENENHISNEQKSQFSTLLEEIKGLVKEKKVDEAKTKVEELQKIWEPIITEIYQKKTEEVKENAPGDNEGEPNKE